MPPLLPDEDTEAAREIEKGFDEEGFDDEEEEDE